MGNYTLNIQDSLKIASLGGGCDEVIFLDFTRLLHKSAMNLY